MSRSIATKTGDDGTTALLYGQRVGKDHPQVEAVGAFDELNVAIGLAKAQLPAGETGEVLSRIQKALVALMGELSCLEADVPRYLASTFPKVGEAELALVEQHLQALEAKGLRFEGWATPGANARAAAFDQARVSARAAERKLIGLAAFGRHARPLVKAFVNRLSDYLWLLAREAET